MWARSKEQEATELCILVLGNLPCSLSTKMFFVLRQWFPNSHSVEGGSAVVSNAKEQQ